MSLALMIARQIADIAGELTTVGRGGVAHFILWEWQDKIGQPINPRLPPRQVGNPVPIL